MCRRGKIIKGTKWRKKNEEVGESGDWPGKNAAATRRRKRRRLQWSLLAVSPSTHGSFPFHLPYSLSQLFMALTRLLAVDVQRNQIIFFSPSFPSLVLLWLPFFSPFFSSLLWHSLLPLILSFYLCLRCFLPHPYTYNKHYI